VATEVKEVVVGTDPRPVEQLGEELRDQITDLVTAGGGRVRCGRLDRWERRDVDLSVWGEGHRRQPCVCGRDHRGQHPLVQEPSQSPVVGPGRVRFGDEVGHQRDPAGGRADRADHRLPHRGMAAQHRLDLARLDPDTADRQLVVERPDELEIPAGQHSCGVPAAVHPRAGPAAVWIGHEPLRGEAWPAAVAAGDAGTAECGPRRARPAGVG
jgi:hypothetical protein